VLLNLTLVGVLPGLGFGLAASTLVGQSLGQGDPQAARQWGWDVAKLAVLVIAALSIVAALVPDGIRAFSAGHQLLVRSPTAVRDWRGHSFDRSCIVAKVPASGTRSTMYRGGAFLHERLAGRQRLPQPTMRQALGSARNSRISMVPPHSVWGCPSRTFWSASSESACMIAYPPI